MMSGIKIILERIKTNPEEFVIDDSANRWMACIENYWTLLTPEEQDQIREGLRGIHMEQFNRNVITTLMIQEKR